MTDKNIQFGAVGTFGDVGGWELQGSTGNAAQVEFELATTLNKDGNESASNTYGDTVPASSEYEAGSGATVSPPANIGAVVNGASELFLEIFGERGAHARIAVGAMSMPLGVAVEIEAVMEVD